ncbi:MAG: DUF2680 domain-containing protein [Peptococcales bacterium]|jgi:hypothetical protein
MKKKTLILISILLLSLVLTTAAFAKSFANPGEIVANLTGKSEVEIYAERNAGKNFGEIAEANGQLEQFRNEMQELKKARIDESVQSGAISKENGEALKKAIEERFALCQDTPGVNDGCLGQKIGGGMGFGRGQGQGMGQAMSRGMGFGRGMMR